jgi:hypothetical protein
MEHTAVVTSLGPAEHPDLVYRYLAGVFGLEARRKADQGTTKMAADLHDQFVTLMCQQDPSAVAPYFATADDFPLDSSLKICQRFRINDATVLLLERAGEIQGALTVLLGDLETKLQDLKVFYLREKRIQQQQQRQQQQQPGEIAEEKAASTFVKACINLCTRNAQRLRDTEAETLWFRLLDTVVLPLRAAK